MILSDIFGIMLSFGAGFFLVNLYDMQAINFKSFVTYWPYLPIFTLLFQIFGLYPGISMAPAEEVRGLSLGVLLGHGGIVFSRYIDDRDFDWISIAFIISFIVSQFILLLCRDCTRMILRKLGLKGIPAVIYGGGKTGRMVADRLLQNKNIGYVPALILDDDTEKGDFYRDVPIMHDTSLGPELVKRYNIKMAIVAMPKLPLKKLAHLLNYSVSVFRYNVLVPSFFGITNIWMSVCDFDGLLGLATGHKLKFVFNRALKRTLDLSLVILGGLVILPFLLILALIIKIDSPGPVIFAHIRLGKNGRPFKAYKFRSMVMDADERLKKMLDSNPALRQEWEENHKLKNDPRITRVGKFMRRTSFDEFPQLINIIKGEMSLVGPRPIVEDEIKRYGDDYQRIFSVKPGLSGLWQVSGRSDTDYASRVSFDTYYLQSWSAWLDIWVLYKTFWVVIRGNGAY